jgi:hypothetical protein
LGIEYMKYGNTLVEMRGDDTSWPRLIFPFWTWGWNYSLKEGKIG